MTSVFRQLPIECTPELSYKQRDTLLSNGEYIGPGGDSVETAKYSIDTNETKDYLRYEYTFTTGQSGFILFELRKFQKENGKTFIVFSRCGGARHAYSQHELKIFDVLNDSLKENNSEALLPKEVNINALLNKQTPDTVKTKIKEAISSCYDLTSSTTNQIEWTIFPEYSDEYEKWVLGYTLTFTWNGNSFDRKLKTEK